MGVSLARGKGETQVLRKRWFFSAYMLPAFMSQKHGAFHKWTELFSWAGILNGISPLVVSPLLVWSIIFVKAYTMEYLHVFVGVSIESLISAKKIHFSRVCILSHFANIQLFSTCYSQSTHVLKGQLSHDYHSFVFFLFHLNFSLQYVYFIFYWFLLDNFLHSKVFKDNFLEFCGFLK